MYYFCSGVRDERNRPRGFVEQKKRDMATFAFDEKRVGFTRNYKHDEFRSMRKFILMTRCYMDSTFWSALVDAIDDVKELREGETLYVFQSRYVAISSASIEQMNERYYNWVITSMTKMGDNYMPNKFSGFMIKKTKALYKYAELMPM